MLLVMCFLMFVAVQSPFPYAAKIRRAWAIADIEATNPQGPPSDKEIAGLMGMDPANFGKAMSGAEGHHLSFQRMLLWPPEVWRAFLPSLCAHYGLRCEPLDGGAAKLAAVLDSLSDLADLIRLGSLPDADAPARRRA